MTRARGGAAEWSGFKSSSSKHKKAGSGFSQSGDWTGETLTSRNWAVSTRGAFTILDQSDKARRDRLQVAMQDQYRNFEERLRALAIV